MGGNKGKNKRGQSGKAGKDRKRKKDLKDTSSKVKEGEDPTTKLKARRKAVKKAASAARRRLSRQAPFDIVYQDRDLIVVNKSGGLLTVPVRGSRVTNLWNLVNQLLQKRRERALIVHRIDRYTSGLVAFAKNKRAREGLIEQFRGHTPRREYLVLVRGYLPERRGELCHYMKLTKDGFRQRVVGSRSKGTKALLNYQVLDSASDVSLVRVSLVTGLKNQIRVQFMAAGFPVVGDRHYVGAELNEGGIDRQALHASLLEIQHPVTEKIMTFEAQIPSDLNKLLRRYRIGLNMR